METRAPLVDRLAQTSLFADLSRTELEAVAHEFDEEAFAEGQRVLRQGLSGSSLYVDPRRRSGRPAGRPRRSRASAAATSSARSRSSPKGPPTSDIVAEGVLHCLVIPRPEVERFLLARPRVMLRMLRAEANRLRGMLEWQS